MFSWNTLKDRSRLLHPSFEIKTTNLHFIKLFTDLKRNHPQMDRNHNNQNACWQYFQYRCEQGGNRIEMAEALIAFCASISHNLLRSFNMTMRWARSLFCSQKKRKAEINVEKCNAIGSGVNNQSIDKWDDFYSVIAYFHDLLNCSKCRWPSSLRFLLSISSRTFRCCFFILFK